MSEAIIGSSGGQSVSGWQTEITYGEESMSEEKKESTKEIVVLDEGIDMDAVVSQVCCGAGLIPLRS